MDLKYAEHVLVDVPVYSSPRIIEQRFVIVIRKNVCGYLVRQVTRPPRQIRPELLLASRQKTSHLTNDHQTTRRCLSWLTAKSKKAEARRDVLVNRCTYVLRPVDEAKVSRK